LARISPNKTWSGFVGGLVATIGAVLVAHFAHLRLVWPRRRCPAVGRPGHDGR
jgi:CDP-diglyceride synthetase